MKKLRIKIKDSQNIECFIRQIFRLYFSLKDTNLVRRAVFGCHIGRFLEKE